MAISATVTEGTSFATGVEISASSLNALGKPTVTVATPIAVGNGGTGSANASAARTALGVAVGSDVQAYDADLSAIGALAKTDGNVIVGNGSTWVVETGSTARTSLGLGSIATQASSSISVTGGTMSGVTITLPSYAVSGVPSASPAGQMIYVTDGNGGSACMSVSDGSNWKVIALGATIST